MTEKEQKASENSSEYLTQKMLETRTVLISGEINDELARDVVNKLLLLVLVVLSPLL